MGTFEEGREAERKRIVELVQELMRKNDDAESIDSEFHDGFNDSLEQLLAAIAEEIKTREV